MLAGKEVNHRQNSRFSHRCMVPPFTVLPDQMDTDVAVIT